MVSAGVCPAAHFADRRERAGTGNDRAQPDRQHLSERMPHSAAGARIRHHPQQRQQHGQVRDTLGSSSGSGRRWPEAERVWSSGSMLMFDVGATIKTLGTTPITFATPRKPTNLRVTAPRDDFAGPWVQCGRPLE